MATAQSVLDSARYDLIDHETGIEFDSTELLEYLNRVIGLLDSALSKSNSDLVEGKEEGIDTVSSQAYVDISSMNSGNWSNVRSVWIDSDRLERISVDVCRYKSMFRSGDEKPQFWALYNQQLLFPAGADSAHTDLVIYYDKKTAALASTTSMPYADIYNEFIREMLVMYAKAKKEGVLERTEVMYQETFRRRMREEELGRNWIPKPYYIDF